MADRGKAFLVEVDVGGARWIKSSASGGDGTGCLEFASVAGRIHVRSSHNRTGPKLSYADPAWVTFIDWVKIGRV